MKKTLLILLTVCLCVVVGCSGNAIVNNAVDMPEVAQLVTYEEPVYQIDSTTNQEQFTAEDGTPLLDYSYELLRLSVVNFDALSPADQSAAEMNVENFNSQMAQYMAAAEEQSRGTVLDAQSAYEQGYMGGEFSDETTVGAVFLGRIISVRIDNYSYFGGAHPNRYTGGLTFDLSAGRFIDPAQLADDPEVFRTEMAKLLIEKADAKGEDYISGYWTEYRDIIACWNEGTVLFDDTGMTVHYSPYEIGPYVMGDVVLTVSYQELAPLIGPGGMEKLGMSAESAE